MPEPTVIVSAVFVALNAISRFAEKSAHFAEVTNEVQQLQINVRLADEAINTANRLVRLKGHFLDHDLLKEVERSVDHTKVILQTLRDSVEACRRDIETKGSVSVKNRAIWVTFRNHEFLSKLATLTNAMNALNRDISRLETARMPELAPPPRYTENSDGDGEQDGIRGFPCSPMIRRKLQQEKSQRSLHSIAADGRDRLKLDFVTSEHLWPSASTYSLSNSVTAVEHNVEQLRSESDLKQVMSAPAAAFELPGSVSLRFMSRSPRSIPEAITNDYLIADWEREKADEETGFAPAPVPRRREPQGPRRRSNLI